MTDATNEPMHFIRRFIEEDLEGHLSSLVTRFPPEPNGFLHIGHAKAICLNFSLASFYKGQCHLRFDDTNPTAEEEAYARAIERDVTWLGFDYGHHLYHASDYYEIFYQLALDLIDQGLAYVDDLDAEQMRAMRGTLTEPGTPSPNRNRPNEESRALFIAMREGKHEEGSLTLRAKIDMASGNINMRDPVIYRVLKATHPRTADAWPIYPMYDYAHPLSDALEGITHSLCTLEFQDHRPLYEWFVDHCAWQEHVEHSHKPRQIEFSRLNLSHTVTSKRKLKALIDGGYVEGWDDPRMPTLSGLRRRGVPPKSIVQLCREVGISKQDSVIDYSVFERCIRDDLNATALRRFAVLDPIEVVIDNYPNPEGEMITRPNHPQNPDMGERQVPFGPRLWIEREDFSENPPPKYQRLTPGGEVRLLGAYAICCDKVIHDEKGEVLRLHCTYHPETKGGKKPSDGRKIKGTIHWLSKDHAIDATVRLFDRLFSHEAPATLSDITQALNPNALQVLAHAKVEASLATEDAAVRYQFIRQGYFCKDSESAGLVFNQIVSLKENWGS